MGPLGNYCNSESIEDIYCILSCFINIWGGVICLVSAFWKRSALPSVRGPHSQEKWIYDQNSAYYNTVSLFAVIGPGVVT